MPTHTLIRHIATIAEARTTCRLNGNDEWFRRHTEALEELEQFLPSGSGINCGTKIDLDASGRDKVVLLTSFHHMNDGGMYDGWTEHSVIVRPAFDGISINVSGRNRNDIKDYLAETFHHTLLQPIEWTEAGFKLAA